MRNNKWTKLGAVLLAAALSVGLLAGCGDSTDKSTGSANTETAAGEKVFNYGDTTFNAENDESDVNPHRG